MTELATLEKEGDVSVITLDDGKVNVFSPAMIEQLNALLDQVPEDSGSLLIQGKDGMFSAGFDLKVMQGGDTQAMSKMASGSRSVPETVLGGLVKNMKNLFSRFF